MRDNSGNGAVVAASALVFILLLTVGGGFYYYFERQRMMLIAQAEQARARAVAEETHAEAIKQRMVAEQTRDKAAVSLPTPDSPLPTPVRSAIESVFRAQQEAWNRGDIDAFMEHYWKSDDLTFSSGGKTTRGWQATLDRYRERYPTPEQMGHLTLSDLEITPLGDSAALVLGQWKLDRETEPVGGNYSIILRKFNDRWLIIHDHTSRLTD